MINRNMGCIEMGWLFGIPDTMSRGLIETWDVLKSDAKRPSSNFDAINRNMGCIEIRLSALLSLLFYD